MYDARRRLSLSSLHQEAFERAAQYDAEYQSLLIELPQWGGDTSAYQQQLYARYTAQLDALQLDVSRAADAIRADYDAMEASYTAGGSTVLPGTSSAPIAHDWSQGSAPTSHIRDFAEAPQDDAPGDSWISRVAAWFE